MGPLVLRVVDAATGAVAPDPIELSAEAGAPVTVLPLAGDEVLVSDGEGDVLFLADGGSAGAVAFTPGAGYPLDQGQRALLISSDLTVAEVTAEPGAPQLDRELDPLPAERFFFNRVALSADGSTLAVARVREVAESNPGGSTVMVFRTGGWELVDQYRFTNRQVDALDLAPDGSRLYIAVSTPDGGPQPPARELNSSLIAIDLGSAESRVLRELPSRARLLIAGR